MALPAQAGQLLVFESGAVKLRLGEVLLDVTFGGAPGFRQEAALLHGTQLLQLGEVPTRAVAAVDVDALLRCSHGNFTRKVQGLQGVTSGAPMCWGSCSQCCAPSGNTEAG